VSAQIYDPYAADPKDTVIVQASTVTDEIGLYMIFLQPGTYNIVAYKDGYSPACTHLIAGPDATYSEDFSLTEALTGTISGLVEIENGSSEQHVTLSFRQLALCEGEDIEVKSLNVANGGTYTVNLPLETYRVVASTYGEDTLGYDTDITAGSDTELDITF